MPKDVLEKRNQKIARDEEKHTAHPHPHSNPHLFGQCNAKFGMGMGITLTLTLTLAQQKIVNVSEGRPEFASSSSYSSLCAFIGAIAA